MGYAKYSEDIQKLTDDRLFLLREEDFIRRPETSPPVFACPYCNIFFNDKAKLSDHIKDCHGAISKLLLLNRQVVQESAHVGKITSVVVVRHDLSEPILINGKPALCEERGDGRERDITKAVLQTIGDSTKVDIQVGDKVWKISVLHLEVMDLAKLEAVRAEWDRKANDHRPIDLDETLGVNDFEKRWLNGFYNYYIACNAGDALKKQRYEDANHFLSEFEQIVPAAKMVLKLIAFRFNWAHSLSEMCGAMDPFATVCEFFFGFKSATTHSFDGDKEIYIEDDLEDSLRAILNYQSGKYDLVDEYLRGFGKEDLMNMQDSNARDRIYLLMARRAAIKGKLHDAGRYYDEIKTPFFEAERERFIKNLRKE